MHTLDELEAIYLERIKVRCYFTKSLITHNSTLHWLSCKLICDYPPPPRNGQEACDLPLTSTSHRYYESVEITSVPPFASMER